MSRHKYIKQAKLYRARSMISFSKHNPVSWFTPKYCKYAKRTLRIARVYNAMLSSRV